MEAVRVLIGSQDCQFTLTDYRRETEAEAPSQDIALIDAEIHEQNEEKTSRSLSSR
jgi:hypothetical protein